VAESLKAILDPRDAAVCARHNHSGKKDSSIFTVTWTIVLVSQGTIEQGGGDQDCGVLDKIAELRPPFEFCAEPQEDNPRQRKADPALADAADAGALSGELFWWACKLFPTITRDVCRGRNLEPAPPSCVAVRNEKGEDHMVKRVRAWMDENLEHCAERNVTPVPELHERLAASLGKVDPSCRSAAGLGPRRYQFRHAGGRISYYRCSLKGAPAGPVRVKGAAASSS
jgi:hypothetical protein